MVAENDDDGSRVRRRELLRTTGVALTPLATAQAVGGQPVSRRRDRDGGSGDRVEIPVRVDENGVVERTTAPRAWVEHVRQVRSVQSSLRRRHAGRADVGSIERVPGDRTVAGKRGLKVRVEGRVADPGGTVEAQTDATSDETGADGVSIETAPIPDSGPGSCGGYTGDVNPAVGGIKCSADYFGTVCIPVSQSGSNERDLVLTAAHLFSSGGACDENITGDRMDQGSDGYGSVIDYDGNADIAVVDGDDYWYDDEDAVSKIKDENGVWPVESWHHAWGIDHLISTGEPVFQMGTTTGQTSGPVTGSGSSAGWNSCVDFEGEGVTCSITNAEGDSGGPIYTYTNDGKASLIGMYQMWIGQTGTRTCSGASLVEAGTLRGIAYHQIAHSHSLWPNS